MKKINWKDVAMMMIMMVIASIGVFLMEASWVEVGSAIIWVAGMISVATIYVANKVVGPVREISQYIQEVYEKMLDQM